jgi:hypothetical protein
MTLPPSYADCIEILEPQPPRNLRTCPGLYRDYFNFLLVSVRGGVDPKATVRPEECQRKIEPATSTLVAQCINQLRHRVPSSDKKSYAGISTSVIRCYTVIEGNPYVNSLTPKLNPSTQRCLPRYLLGILNFKGLTARRIYKSFGVKGLNAQNICLLSILTCLRIDWRTV